MRLAELTMTTLAMLTLADGGALAAENRVELKLWPAGAPGETGAVGPERAMPPQEGQRQVVRLTDIAEPTITLYKAPAANASGTAVVICPGGGYNILAWDLEGTEVAEWLNSIGVTAVLLKYRVPRRDKDTPYKAPLQDAQRAMRLVRRHAAEWGIDAGRVGMLGFSAGGNLTVLTGTHWDTNAYAKVDEADDLSSRPDFLLPIYPAYLGHEETEPERLRPEIRINKETPPMFLVVAWDDKLRAVETAAAFIALKKAGTPAELHIFSRGGHGYGLRPSEDPVSGWPKLAEQWLRVNGLLR